MTDAFVELTNDDLFGGKAVPKLNGVKVDRCTRVEIAVDAGEVNVAKFWIAPSSIKVNGKMRIVYIDPISGDELVPKRKE